MASPNFSGTIVGGIQDISALLPLLGTEQCEEHVGSALDRGFLYSSVTPISIFGSLGIVRASFNILTSSINIRRYRFLGAKKLSDGGFTSKGVVAPMIGVDRNHPKRFLIETLLVKMLQEGHIENVEDLTVSWGKGLSWWNFMLVLSTLVVAATGLIPYIIIVRQTDISTHFLPSGWGFPFFRVLGSALCVTISQLLIQIRIMVLLKTRLLFITIDRLAKDAGIDDVEMLIHPSGAEGKKWSIKERKPRWSPDIASEGCIWALRRWLASNRTRTDPDIGVHQFTKLQTIYREQNKRLLGSMNKSIPHWVTHLLVGILVIGIIMTVAGYIGCFYLIQHSQNELGPLIWLVLEALLSVIRIIVWAINPSWDDSKGIFFELQLANHAPLLTCSKYEDDIIEDGLAPAINSTSFLEDVVAYTGPLPPLNLPDVSLYYIYTAKGSKPDSPKLPHRVLYVVVSDYKEQTSRILVKKERTDKFSIYVSSLEPFVGGMNVKAILSPEGSTEADTHSFTANASVMDQLSAHYDTILSKLEKKSACRTGTREPASFSKTWALQPQPEEERDEEEPHGAVMERTDKPEQDTLTQEDMTYLCQGEVERRWGEMLKRIGEWTAMFMSFYAKELLRDINNHLECESVTIAQKYEVNEVEYLLGQCQVLMEIFMSNTSGEWTILVGTLHRKMVDSVLDQTFPAGRKMTISEGVRKRKLKSRLDREQSGLSERTSRFYTLARRGRLQEQATFAEERIRRRKYRDQAGEAILKIWNALRDSDMNINQPWPTFGGEDTTFESFEDPLSSASTFNVFDDDISRCESPILDFTNQGPLETAKGDFMWLAERRFEQGRKEIKDKFVNPTEQDKDTLKDQLGEFERMTERCAKRADILFSRMQDRMQEFEELHTDDILTADSHNLAAYWSSESLRERGRLMDRSQKHLTVSDDFVRVIGGYQNLARTLKLCESVTVIDIVAKTLDAKDVLSLLRGRRTITGFSASQHPSAPEVFEKVKIDIDAGGTGQQDACFYEDALLTDIYRQGHPYHVFMHPGFSSCTAIFYTKDRKESDHAVTLRHCMTTAGGVVDISLNGIALERTWGESQMVKDNFTDETIRLPGALLSEFGKLNVLKIVLARESPGVYWLSDVFLPVRLFSAADIDKPDAE